MKYHCWTNYCTGPQDAADVTGKDAALRWLAERQDPAHMEDGNRALPTQIRRDGTIVADLTVRGCVSSSGYAEPCDD